MALADCNAAECSEPSMPGLGKTGTVRASVTASSARGRDIYQRYAVALYRQALLTAGDPAWAEDVVYDVIVNERALALMGEHGEARARHRGVLGIYSPDLAAPLRAVLSRLTTSSSARRDR
jgi:hypothetical protein